MGRHVGGRNKVKSLLRIVSMVTIQVYSSLSSIFTTSSPERGINVGLSPQTQK